MLMSLLLTQLAVGHGLAKSDLPVDATSFCRAMFIDMAGQIANYSTAKCYADTILYAPHKSDTIVDPGITYSCKTGNRV